MASIDLISAFDVVDIVLLIKTLKIVGLPDNLVTLVEIWLKGKYFYVSDGNDVSTIMVSWYGIIQGSILGPVLFTLFISPLF